MALIPINPGSKDDKKMNERRTLQFEYHDNLKSRNSNKTSNLRTWENSNFRRHRR